MLNSLQKQLTICQIRRKYITDMKRENEKQTDNTAMDSKVRMGQTRYQ